MAVGVTVGVRRGDEVGPAAQVGAVIVLVSRETWPLRASIRPCTVAPVWRLIEVSARTDPTNVVAVPRVAELPTCQKTWHAWAPPTSATVLLLAVISVEPAWKTKTASGSPPASRVTVPVSAIAPAAE